MIKFSPSWLFRGLGSQFLLLIEKSHLELCVGSVSTSHGALSTLPQGKDTDDTFFSSVWFVCVYVGSLKQSKLYFLR